MTGTILLEREGHLAHLVLNRPHVLNAIDNELAEDLSKPATRSRRIPRCGSSCFAARAIELFRPAPT